MSKDFLQYNYPYIILAVFILFYITFTICMIKRKNNQYKDFLSKYPYASKVYVKSLNTPIKWLFGFRKGLTISTNNFTWKRKGRYMVYYLVPGPNDITVFYSSRRFKIFYSFFRGFEHGNEYEMNEYHISAALDTNRSYKLSFHIKTEEIRLEPFSELLHGNI